eukprot:jgi/Astpho2/9030/fgenesh1_pg.00133_%23_58_t
MRLSGWAGLGALAVASALFCLSGRLLVGAFDQIPAHMSHTYPALGVAALGSNGKYLVASVALAEFFGGSCMMLIVEWRILAELLPMDSLWGLSTFHVAAGLSLAVTLPMLLIPTFQKLSWLNLMGFLSTALVTATVMAAAPPAGHDVFEWSIIQAFGIFAVSVSGHSSLPVLRNSMAKPQDFSRVLALAFSAMALLCGCDFPRVVTLAFSAMALLYGCVSAAGYYYWGNGALTLVTSDLALHSPFARNGRLPVDKLVDACILVNVFTTYPSLVLVMQDMVVSVLPWSGPENGWRQPRRRVVYSLRLTIFALSVLLAVVGYSALGNVMSLVGGLCSMCCSLLMPATFYLILHKDLRLWQRLSLMCIVVSGIGLVILVVAPVAFLTCDRL